MLLNLDPPVGRSHALRKLPPPSRFLMVARGTPSLFSHPTMQPSERAVLTVLLLRGPQSAGEIPQRNDRLHTFFSLDEVEETLTWFIEYPHGPLVRRIQVGEGRRVESFAHLL